MAASSLAWAAALLPWMSICCCRVHSRKQQHGSTNSSRCFSSGVFWGPGGCPFEIRESTARVLSETKKRPPPACRTLASGPRPACWVRWDLSVRGKSSMLHLKLSTLNRMSAVLLQHLHPDKAGRDAEACASLGRRAASQTALETQASRARPEQLCRWVAGNDDAP